MRTEPIRRRFSIVLGCLIGRLGPELMARTTDGSGCDLLKGPSPLVDGGLVEENVVGGPAGGAQHKSLDEHLRHPF